MKLIITRHTTTEWNTLGKIQGHKDIPLNDEGKQEARELGEKLKEIHIDGIISSDLIRALETAQIINETIQVPLESTRELRECSFGTLEGMVQDEITEKYGENLIPDLQNKTLTYDFHTYGGENKSEVLGRHMNVIHELSKGNTNETAILLVGHSLSMGTLLEKLGASPIIEQTGFKIIEYWPS